MSRIVALSGSLRSGSFNTALARVLAERAPAGCEVEVCTPAEIPLYDGDLEAEQGVPVAAQRLKDRVAESDGLIIVTPEYNQAVPGVMKNTLDWMTRPPQDIGRVFGDRAVALCGASAGAGGSRVSQYALLPTLRALGTRLWSGKALYVGGAGKVFDESGKLVDSDIDTRATEFIAAFHEFVSGRYPD